MPYPGWQPTPGCLANVAKFKGRICSDPQTHCWDTQDYTHKQCDCEDPFLGGCTSSPPPLPQGCCHNTADSPIPSYDKQGMCYCCCSCFSYDTPIAYAGAAGSPEFRAVQDFAVGDKVLAADAKLNWQEVPLQFSSGAPAKRSALIKIDYMDGGAVKSLLVTRSHLFLRPDGKLIRADRLMPQDPLVLAAGGTTPVQAITAGVFDKGVHHIATSVGPATGIAGHLLNSNGVVTGDYALQISGITTRDSHALMAPNHDKLPVFGTEAYRAVAVRVAGAAAPMLAPAAAHPATARAVNHVSALAAAGGAGYPHPQGFHAVAGYAPSHPPGTQSYFTDDRAWDIQCSPDRAPVGSSVGSDVARYLNRLFGGMYPNIRFELDERDDSPNAYAFEFFDDKYVVVASGLVRVNALTMAGLAAIMAHCVARLQKLKPLNQDGFTCRTNADYAVPAVLGYVFLGELYGTVISGAVAELQALYAMVSDKPAGGVAGDTCMQASLACRLSALNASMRGMPLPECAGGPKDATLTVTGATAAMGAGGKPEVTVTFSAPIDPASAGHPANYQFDPPVAVDDAAVDARNPAAVVLHPRIEKGTDYALQVFDVISATGHPLVPSGSRADVTLT
jgi:hypothetical protein